MAPALPPRNRFCSLCGAPLGDCTADRCVQLGPTTIETEPAGPITAADIAQQFAGALETATDLTNIARNALRGLARIHDRAGAGGIDRKEPNPR